MKAIETIYHGYRTRSRVEARWMIFFDTLGIEYRYEMEGYQLSNGVFYLPDFWLPDYGTWVEIKGKEPSEEEKEKCRRLATESKRTCILLAGDVWPSKYTVLLYTAMGRDPLPCQDITVALMISPTKQQLSSAYIAARQARFEHGEQGLIQQKTGLPIGRLLILWLFGYACGAFAAWHAWYPALITIVLSLVLLWWICRERSA